MFDIEFLKKVDLFAGLNDSQLESLCESAKQQEFKQGTKIFSEGEKAGKIFAVLEGKVDLRFELPGGDAKENSSISDVPKCKSFGWSGLVPPNRYSLSAYCVSDKCLIVGWDKKTLLDYFEKDVSAGYRVMVNITNIIGSRFRYLQKKAAEMPHAKIEVTVHMATCGIAAGAREVMASLLDEIKKSGRKDIHVETAGCLGDCPSHPNVTVKIGWENPIVYQKMTAEKMGIVFREHILGGKVQSEFLVEN